MSEQIMTPEQLQGLHDDIRDGISMIVETKHYEELEHDNLVLAKTLCGLQASLLGLKSAVRHGGGITFEQIDEWRDEIRQALEGDKNEIPQT